MFKLNISALGDGFDKGFKQENCNFAPGVGASQFNFDAARSFVAAETIAIECSLVDLANFENSGVLSFAANFDLRKHPLPQGFTTE